MSRAREIAKKIRKNGELIPELCAELCELAGMYDELVAADPEDVEDVVTAAAERLGVEI